MDDNDDDDDDGIVLSREGGLREDVLGKNDRCAAACLFTERKVMLLNAPRSSLSSSLLSWRPFVDAGKQVFGMAGRATSTAGGGRVREG